MVSRRLMSRRSLVAGSIALLLALGAALPAVVAVPPNDPGPFYPLVVGYEGLDYSDALPSGAVYSLRSGGLPGGLTMSRSGGVSGTPSETGTFRAVYDAEERNGNRYPVRLALTVFASDESNRPTRAASFTRSGPFRVSVENTFVDMRSSFDNERIRTQVRTVVPRGSGPFPVLLFHRGRGFDHDSYTTLHEKIASHGIAVVSVRDSFSFTGDTFRATQTVYDRNRAELGMQSASAVVEGVTDALLTRSIDPTDTLYNTLDADAIFFAGHSRGGGAVHASHERSFQLRLRGVIYLMAFDLRYFDACRPPNGRRPAYPIFDSQPRTPSLIIAAENDGDLTYPIADELIDRAAGPTTQVTVYGGVHNLISDSHGAEGNARISRTSEQTQVADWIVCFIKRWAEDDLRCDRRLYGEEHEADTDVGVAYWRPSARTLLLEDAQDADDARNLVGRNLVLNMRRRETSLYPAMGDFPSLGLQHTLVTPTDKVSAWRLASDTPIDTTDHARLVLRTAQTSDYGWSWCGLWARAIDVNGNEAWQRIHEPSAAGSPFPDPTNAISTHARFLEVGIKLDDFFVSQGNPAVDFSQITAVDLFVVVRDQARAGSVAFDMVRFE
ncbi:putative Ig domain-containing protein [Planctomycetota bacterium]|nr:putative Ig domain-containing protein [Planctomycetota bacterium]